MKQPKSIRSLFSLPGFVAASALGGVFSDRYARVIVLRRRKKPPCARGAVTAVAAATTSRPVAPATAPSAAGGSAEPPSAPLTSPVQPALRCRTHNGDQPAYVRRGIRWTPSPTK